jgi:hypothetical protein
MASFGEGLGAVIGASMGAGHLEEGVDKVNSVAGDFGSSVKPYNDFGQGFLAPTSNILLGQTTGDGTIGQQRLEGRGNDVMQYDDFMKGYSASPGAKYLIGQAEEAQNNSAAAKGKLLSGGNLRGLAAINEGLGSTFANQAYGQYLAGNNQQFQQLEQSLGNMFTAMGIGQTATGQQAGVASSQMNANASLAAAQAKNDQSKGSGLGSMFSGLGSLATMF